MFALLSLIFCFFQFNQNDISIDEYIDLQLRDYSKVEYEVVSLPSGIESINDKNIKFNGESKYKLNGSYLYIPVDYVKEGKHLVKSSITLKVKLFKQVYVARKDIKKGELISLDDFEFQEREISSVRGNVEIDLLSKNLYRAKGNIKTGAILESSLIEANPVVKAGDELTAFKLVGNLMVSFSAKAREEGEVGKKIRVVRDDNKIFKAEIIDSVSVKIIE